ncbi:hypothetical protein AN639_09500 [Candidatus Epulonipiscium fishelsonii]|nr:hypothetical protein AN639_09500 [Epulopiscium sp. SCG-B05WGA-EpuloA1]
MDKRALFFNTIKKLLGMRLYNYVKDAIKETNKILLNSLLNRVISINRKRFRSNPCHMFIEVFKRNKNLEGQLFLKDFRALTKNLDDNSIITIIKSLNRMKKIKENKFPFLILFDKQEEKSLNQMKEDISHIIKLSNDIYQYKNYQLPKRHFEASVFYYKHQLHEVSNLNKIKDKSIIDVGGFIGDSVLVFNELNPKNIYTFEAMPENFKFLIKTIKLNNIKNVTAINVALGNKEGYCNMQVAANASSSVMYLNNNNFKIIKVPVITLDSYVKKNNIEVGLIKTDIDLYY